MSRDDQNVGPLSEAERDEIRQICRDGDFPVQNIDGSDEILRVTPANLADLPNADGLNRLADRLEQLGYRYVTFSVPDSDGDR